MIKRIAVGWLLFGVSLAAQGPGAFTTVTLTNTSATALCVGCAIGSSSASGGIKAGPIDVSSVVTAGSITIASAVPGDTTNRLYNNGGSLFFNGAGLATGGSISGTLNTIPVFTGTTSVGNSIMTQSGTTITVANTLNATTLGGTLSTASQTNITGVGTITTGVWSGTIVAVAKGGTGVSLAATGGTNQVLRQDSVGATITVSTLASTQLSDTANLPYINAVNTFTARGTHTWSATGAGTNGILVTDASAGTGNTGFVEARGDETSGVRLSMTSSTYNTAVSNAIDPPNIASMGALVAGRGNGTTTGGMAIVASNGPLRLYAGSQATAAVIITGAGGTAFGGCANPGATNVCIQGTTTMVGKLLYGTSTVDQTVVPGASCSGGQTITGNGAAFLVTPIGTGTCTVTFNAAYAAASICVGYDQIAATYTAMTSAGGASSFAWTGTAGHIYQWLCRGY